MTRLILLHGAPGEGAQWQPVVDALRAATEVLCPTLRWFGSGPWPDNGGGFGTRAHTGQLIEVLEKGPPCAIAAWSYSTHVVLNLLVNRPELVSRAFLYEPGLSTYLHDEASISAYNADAAAAFGPVAAALQAHGPEAALEALFDASGGPDCFRRLPAERQSLYLASARIMPLLLGAGQPPSNITHEVLSGIARPVMVACGSRTRPLFGIASRAVAEAIPGCRFRVVQGADHMLPETHPHAFAALLDEWLADRDAAGRAA